MKSMTKSIKQWIMALAGLWACLALLPQSVMAADNPDWANLGAYRAKDAALLAKGPQKHRVVFMGDSITEGWDPNAQSWFAQETFVNRGISGQTTPQMVLRFRQDVIDLKPAVVVILAGTNDVAGNTGPATPEMIVGNIATMAELARAHGIKAIICSVIPTNHYPWAPDVKPAQTVMEINERLKTYAKAEGFIYVDYYAAMVDDKAGLRGDYGDDGVHPNGAGYAVMEALMRPAIAKALKHRLGDKKRGL
jgi:lysophospholipase L1-like esterase